MSKFIVRGGNKLDGEVSVHGAKNAILPILAATLLNQGESVIHNCPRLHDVFASVNILEHLGCEVKWEGESTLRVKSHNVVTYSVPNNLMSEMRSSIIFLGAILARCGQAVMSYPGG